MSRTRLPLLAALTLMALVLPASSLASFPGTNGRIAFVSTRGLDGDPEIWTVAGDGSGATQLTDNLEDDDFSPAWSPDGKRLAFSSNRDSTDPLKHDLYLMNADGGAVVRLTDSLADDREPAWAPGGKRLVFVSDRAGSAELYTIRRDGSGLRRLTKTAADEAVPDWSPDGRRIVFARNGGIWVVGADGRSQKPLARVAGAVAWSPSWSPDGKWIAFQWNLDTGETDPTDEIWVMRANGAAKHRLTRNQVEDIQPSWSPDGRWIAFASDREVLQSIYAMRPNGKDLRAITATSIGLAPGDFMPAWQRLR